MLRTTVVKQDVAKKGNRSHNINGEPSSRRVVKTSVSIDSAGKDSFLTKRESRGLHIKGSHKA